jgi:hypothetical protein
MLCVSEADWCVTEVASDADAAEKEKDIASASVQRLDANLLLVYAALSY